MPEHHSIVTGTITHIFFHRFVVKTKKGDLLADVTPKGVEQIVLHVGDTVKLEGEMKPSELKVFHLTRNGKTIQIEHKKKHDHEHHPHADPQTALTAARDLGFEPLGEPCRKPKHFEVLARRANKICELHIELDGHLRKTKPVDGDDHKWRDALRKC
jgi:hypothetical protein